MKTNIQPVIAFNLPDGSACYGSPLADRPGVWWLRHTRIGDVDAATDAAAPAWARQQAETALAGGGWPLGDVITVTEVQA